jgi:hypothetical protein
VKLTTDYILRCDHIFIACNVIRAVTNASVRDSLLHVIEECAPREWEERGCSRLSLAIVCTKIEVSSGRFKSIKIGIHPLQDMDVKSAKRKYCHPGKRINPCGIEQLEGQIHDATHRRLFDREKELMER